MMYKKTQWVDRKDPTFDVLNSPEIDADNLNKIEGAIETTIEAINNVSSAFGIINTGLSQDVLLTPSTLTWDIGSDTTNEVLFTFNATNNTITIKKAGRFNFLALTSFEIGTALPLEVSISVLDAILDTVVSTESIELKYPVGSIVDSFINIPLEFLASDVPKTVKLTQHANLINTKIKSITYTLNTFASNIGESGLSDHSELTGNSNENCHPITAITDLDSTLFGTNIIGEPI